MIVHLAVQINKYALIFLKFLEPLHQQQYLCFYLEQIELEMTK